MLTKISSVISLSFLAIFLLVSNAHSSSDWLNYSSDEYGVHLYKIGDIDKKDGKYIVQVSKKRVFSDEGRIKYIQATKKGGIWTKELEKVLYIVRSLEIDCKKQMSKQPSIVIYDKNGKIISSEYYDQSPWTSIVSGSDMDSLRKKVCK
jgi:hypothetical protein